MKIVKLFRFGANGYTDPRDVFVSKFICDSCSKMFSYWDDINLSPNDEKPKCANCKGIQIELIRK